MGRGDGGRNQVLDIILLTWPVHVKFAPRWTPSNLKVSTRWTIPARVEGGINWIEATKKHLFSFGCIELHVVLCCPSKKGGKIVCHIGSCVRWRY